MTRKPPVKLSRRKALRWIAATPAAAALGGAALGQVQEPSDFGQLDKLADSQDDKELEESRKEASAGARCIADNEDLSRAEKKALLDKMKGLEGALQTLRDFEIAGDVEPAINFRAVMAGGRRS